VATRQGGTGTRTRETVGGRLPAPSSDAQPGEEFEGSQPSCPCSRGPPPLTERVVRFSQGPGREAGLTTHRRYSWIFTPLPHLGVSLSNVSNDHTFVIVYSPCAGCWAAPGFPNDRRGSPFRRQHTQALFPRREGMATACRPQSGVTLPSVHVWHRHHGVVSPFCPCSRGPSKRT